MKLSNRLPTITKTQIEKNGVSALADRPNLVGQYGQGGLSSKQLKEWFDGLARLIANTIESTADIFAGDDAAKYIRIVLDDYGVNDLSTLITSFTNGTFAEKVLLLANPLGEDSGKKQSLTAVLSSFAGELAQLSETFDENKEKIDKDIELINQNISALGATLKATANTVDYKIKFELISLENEVLSTQEIDLPLESVVVNGSYDADTKKVILVLQNSSIIEFSVADLINGLVSQETFEQAIQSLGTSLRAEISNTYTNSTAYADGEIEKAVRNVDGRFAGVQANFDAVDEEIEAIRQESKTALTLAKGAKQAISFNSYWEMVNDERFNDVNAFSDGQDIFIKTTNVPDLWVFGKNPGGAEPNWKQDTINVDLVAELLKTDAQGNPINKVQVGEYILSPLETQKVNLTDHYTKEELEALLRDIVEESRIIIEEWF